MSKNVGESCGSINLVPLYDRLIVAKIEEENKTPGGVIIPDSAKEKPTKGKVVAVGKGTRSNDGKIIPLEVKVNDIVIFAKWGGTEIKHHNQDYVILKESDILAVDPK